MIVICNNCGHPNNVKGFSFKTDHLKTVCKKCGFQTTIATGTTGVRQEPVKKEEAGEDIISSLFSTEETPFPEEGPLEEVEEEAYRRAQSKKFGRSIAILMLFLVVPVLVSTLGNIYTRIKTTEAVNTARTYVAESGDIASLTGSDVVMDVTGTQLVRDRDGTERARIEVDVSGRDGSGTVVVYMKRSGGEWIITAVHFIDPSSDRPRQLPLS